MTAEQLTSRANMLYPGPNSMSSMGEDLVNEGANKAYRKGYQEAVEELIDFMDAVGGGEVYALREMFRSVHALPIQKEWKTEPDIEKPWRS